ncbi:hypothetical protein [Nocardia sp. NBC_01329]|uniref:hypothetical protein n=1 Tax=Nocardia sp. NBC_01329 TaxID=2903594 RepID=UPI002E0EBE31|nr:hypothetical protein OG405_02615 [Nocardia sp. NBC_01329]
MFSKSTVLAVAVLVPLLVTGPAADAVAAPAPVPCSMFCEDKPPSAKDCTMFCTETPVPPADARGCRLLCDLGKPQGQGVV